MSNPKATHGRALFTVSRGDSGRRMRTECPVCHEDVTIHVDGQGTITPHVVCDHFSKAYETSDGEYEAVFNQ